MSETNLAQKRCTRYMRWLRRKINRAVRQGRPVEGLRRELAYCSGQQQRPPFVTGRLARDLHATLPKMLGAKGAHVHSVAKRLGVEPNDVERWMDRDVPQVVSKQTPRALQQQRRRGVLKASHKAQPSLSSGSAVVDGRCQQQAVKGQKANRSPLRR
ncbi:MAG: hypothetical protein AAFS10_25935 [Myxococcota bacterium]